MKNFIIFGVFFTLAGCSLFSSQSKNTSAKLPPKKKESYASFEDLKKSEKEGIDYRVKIETRSSPLTVFAIHGGHIEEGTDIIARHIAGKDYTSYIFWGARKALHLTSTKFDEPRALGLTKTARVCLSIHGYEDDREQICVGGGSAMFKKQLITALDKSNLGFPIVENCRGLEGVKPENIVNRCLEQGAQLEFSSGLRDRLLSDNKLLKQVTSIIRHSSAIFMDNRK